jgi:predicted HD superfamily hydrolase involved in NAD metabolism
METAGKLAALHGADVRAAEVAGLLHDNARDLSGGELLALCPRFGIAPCEAERLMPCLLHGPVGAGLAKERFGIADERVADAIRWHTTGKADMAPLAKIIFVADAIEPGRDYAGVETARALAFGRQPGAARSDRAEHGAQAERVGHAGQGAQANHGDLGMPEAPGAPDMLDAAVLHIVASQMIYLIKNKSYVHPLTLQAWNHMARDRLMRQNSTGGL